MPWSCRMPIWIMQSVSFWARPSALVPVAAGDKTTELLAVKLKQAMRSLKVGAFSNSDNDFGPHLITGQHKNKVRGYIDSAEKDGANVAIDDHNPQIEGFASGFYIGATLIDGVTPAMQSYKEEIFGPVLQVMRTASMAEAMQFIKEALNKSILDFSEHAR